VKVGLKARVRARVRAGVTGTWLAKKVSTEPTALSSLVMNAPSASAQETTPLVHALRIFLSALYGMYKSSHGPHCAASSVWPNFMPARSLVGVARCSFRASRLLQARSESPPRGRLSECARQ